MTGTPPQERLSLKWSAHVSEVEVTFFLYFHICQHSLKVVEGTSTGTLARMVNQPGGILAGVAKKASFCF